MAVKRITIRVSPQLHGQLVEAAAQHGDSLNQFLVETLEAGLRQQAAGEGSAPMQELSALLAPAADAQGLTEEMLLTHLREARRRIWEERYRHAVEAVQASKP